MDMAMATTIESQFESTNLNDTANIGVVNHNTTHTLPDRMLAPMIFVVFLSVIGIPGNILILLVFRLKHKSSVYRTIIMTMAVNDLLVCTVTLPFEFYNLFNQYTFNEKWICKIFRTLNYFFVFNSSSIIHLLAVDRFRRVCRPLRRQMSQGMVMICIVVIGCASIMATIPNLIIRGTLTKPRGNSTTTYECSISDKYITSKIPVIYNTSLLITCISNIAVIIILYIFIGREIFRHFQFLKSLRYRGRSGVYKTDQISTVSSSKYTSNKHITDLPSSESNTNDTYPNGRKKLSQKAVISEKQSYKSTKMAIMITVFFIISYFPSLAENIIEDIYGKKYLSGYLSLSVLNIFQKMFAINHAINPFIYGFVDKTFRKDCKEICMKFICTC